MRDLQDAGASSGAPASGLEIAIVGMAGRFPGAPDIASFWQNLRDGVESVKRYSKEELLALGVSPQRLAESDYVRAGVPFEGADRFDAELFGYTPREAERLDPQHRVFLECAWEALENTGCDPQRWPGVVAVFAGAGANVYLLRHLLPRSALGTDGGIAELLDLVGSNGAETLCTRVAYKLGLRGPAITVQTACSTSLVAVHLAGQSLLAGECDMALAGGVSLNLLQQGGYRFQPGAILSPDGHCRAFDAQAQGTVLGSGAGVVVLKRLEDARRDGDHIHAVIRATAANNDASDKVGFTAPSVNGQAAVIRAAHLLAGVTADTISYVEAHGTGTTLGDPIELAALTQAFRASTPRSGYCALGSVKTNVGHLDCAAGVAGLIKTALALQHRTLPASLHYREPNPRIDFTSSPFRVNAVTRPWESTGGPRRAGVSGFGIGGTNVHAVLEEAPPPPAPVIGDADGGWQVLPLSAASEEALKQVLQRLSDHLSEHPQQRLADVAHTLQMGRRALAWRTAVVARERADAVQALARALDDARPVDKSAAETVFMFPGGGVQHARMCAALYHAHPVFRAEADRCLSYLGDSCGLDLRACLLPEPGQEDEADRQLVRMEYGQPAVFVVCYALARWWMSVGVKPAAMIGHSLGEYVAACLSGVFSLEDALRIVVGRARLQQAQAPGAMTSVLLSEEEVQPWLDAGCELAVVNGERLCVLAGSPASIEAAEQGLTQAGQVPRRVNVAVAAHSSMTEPIMGALESLVASAALQAPRVPFISNVTGRPITAQQATSPTYWAQHLRSTVRFREGLDALLASPGRVMLEVGPGDVLSSLARQHPQAAAATATLASQARLREHEQNDHHLALAAAGLWKVGVALDWQGLSDSSTRRRVPLPTYPFQHRSYWLPAIDAAPTATLPVTTRQRVDDWFYVPSWRRVEPLAAGDSPSKTGCSIVLGDGAGFTAALADGLALPGQGPVIRVVPAAGFARLSHDCYELRPAEREDWSRLLRELEQEVGSVARVCHVASLGRHEAAEALDTGLFGLMALVQALGETELLAQDRTVSLVVLSDRLQNVMGDEAVCAEKAALLGLCKVLAHEYPGLHARVIDLSGAGLLEGEAPCVAREVLVGREQLVAYRAGCRWLRSHERVTRPAGRAPRLRERGVYLITGGFGGLGMAFAHYLARHWQARLVLLGSGHVPPRGQWEALIAADDAADPMRARSRELLELESIGAEVLALRTDVTDVEQVREAMELARERFGAVHGLIHAAGRPGGGLLALQSPAAMQEVLAPKLAGARHLLDALREEPMDFAMLCSALVWHVGGLGQAAYCAANAGTDGLAEQTARECPWPVISVGWDVWRGLGMAQSQQLPEELGIDPAQAGELLERLLAGPATPQVLVSTVPLEAQSGYAQVNELSRRLQTRAPARGGQQHPRPALATAYLAPANETERTLVGIWSELLGVSPVGVNDNLFELGGDSLLAVQAVSRARAALQADFAVAEVLRVPTPAQVARLIARAGQGRRTGLVFDADVAARAVAGEPLPASYAQQRLWFLWKMNPQRVAFNITRAFRLEGALDVAAVRETVQRLVARHAVLRTVFVEDDGMAMQRVLPTMAVDVPVADLRAQGGGPAQLDDYLRARVREPFDLANGPLLRAELFRVDEAVHILVVVMHHVAMDGWSVALLMQEFAQLYDARQRGLDVQLVLPRVGYADFAVAQRQWLESGEMDRQAEYWRRQLQGVEPLVLPHDKVPPPQRRHPVRITRFALANGMHAQLKEASRARSVTPYVFLLAATAVVLSERAGQRRFHVGTDMANRNQVETEAMIGFFVNLAAIRVDCETPRTMDQLMGQLQTTVVDAASHQDLPFDRLVEVVGRRRAGARAPLFQVKVLYRDDSEANFSLSGVMASEHPLDPVEAELDLMVTFLLIGEQLRVELAYDSELYADETIEALRAEILDTLEACLADPGIELDRMRERLTLLRAQNRARLAVERAERLAAMRSGLRSRSAISQCLTDPGPWSNRP